MLQVTKVEGWDKNYIKDKDLFVAQLGPTGGQKGYGTITGELPSEKSVCWWINGKLMPEIYVYRGRTYYFRVQVYFSHFSRIINFQRFIEIISIARDFSIICI